MLKFRVSSSSSVGKTTSAEDLGQRLENQPPAATTRVNQLSPVDLSATTAAELSSEATESSSSGKLSSAVTETTLTAKQSSGATEIKTGKQPRTVVKTAVAGKRLAPPVPRTADGGRTEEESRTAEGGRTAREAITAEDPTGLKCCDTENCCHDVFEPSIWFAGQKRKYPRLSPESSPTQVHATRSHSSETKATIQAKKRVHFSASDSSMKDPGENEKKRRRVSDSRMMVKAANSQNHQHRLTVLGQMEKSIQLHQEGLHHPFHSVDRPPASSKSGRIMENFGGGRNYRLRSQGRESVKLRACSDLGGGLADRRSGRSACRSMSFSGEEKRWGSGRAWPGGGVSETAAYRLEALIAERGRSSLRKDAILASTVRNTVQSPMSTFGKMERTYEDNISIDKVGADALDDSKSLEKERDVVKRCLVNDKKFNGNSSDSLHETIENSIHVTSQTSVKEPPAIIDPGLDDVGLPSTDSPTNHSNAVRKERHRRSTSKRGRGSVRCRDLVTSVRGKMSGEVGQGIDNLGFEVYLGLDDLPPRLWTGEHRGSATGEYSGGSPFNRRYSTDSATEAQFGGQWAIDGDSDDGDAKSVSAGEINQQNEVSPIVAQPQDPRTGKRWSLDSGFSGSIHSRNTSQTGNGSLSAAYMTESALFPLKYPHSKIFQIGSEMTKRQYLNAVSHAGPTASKQSSPILTAFSILSLVMNVHTLVQLPGFILEWRGAGLLVYLLATLLLGLPVFHMELTVGDMCRGRGLSPWSSLTPLATGLGPALATNSVFLATQCCLMMAYSSLYLVTFLSDSIAPWSSCQEWWGADHRCFSVGGKLDFPMFSNQSAVWNTSDFLCQLYTRDRKCYITPEPSYQQFWNKYILQIDIHGLKSLGYLGTINSNLAYSLFVILLVTGILLIILRNQERQIWIAGNLAAIAVLCTGLCLKNMLELGSVERINSILTWDGTVMFNGTCWVEALVLVINGLSVFNGSVTAYSVNLRGNRHKKLISLLALLVHILFSVAVFASVVLILPVRDEDDPESPEYGLGYLPLALTTQAMATLQHSKYQVPVFHIMVLLCGLSSLLGLCSSVLSTLRTVRLPSCGGWLPKLTGFFVTSTVFLISLPLCYGAGSSLLVVFHRYGVHVPAIAIGLTESFLIFWCYGASRLVKEIPGRSYWNVVLRGSWSLNPLYMIISVLFLVVFWQPLSSPSPLPPWAPHLGIFISAISLTQVMGVASLIAIFAVTTGDTDIFHGRRNYRPQEHVQTELSSSYQNLDMFQSKF